MRAQAVVNMQCHNLEAQALGRGERGSQQRGGITAAAVGHRDARSRHGVCQRSVVSVKRP